MNVDHRSSVPPASPAPAAPPRALRHARVAVAAVFFLDGMGFGNWVVRIPAVRERLGLGEGALGLALLGVAVGALIAMPVAGRLVGRRGSRPVTRVALVWSSHRSGAATCSPRSAISRLMPSRSSTWPIVLIVARSCLISVS